MGTEHCADGWAPREIPGVPGSHPLPPTIAVPKIRDPRLLLRHRLHGISALSDGLVRRTTNLEPLLAAGGALMFGHGMLHGPLKIHNADGDYRHLWIGHNVHLGPNCLLDLTSLVEIEHDATISMGCTILTHTNVGDRPLRDRVRRLVLDTVIGHGAYLGANVTVLPGCDIGPEAVVAAGAVVTRPVKAGAKVGGVPAHPL